MSPLEGTKTFPYSYSQPCKKGSNSNSTMLKKLQTPFNTLNGETKTRISTPMPVDVLPFPNPTVFQSVQVPTPLASLRLAPCDKSAEMISILIPMFVVLSPKSQCPSRCQDLIPSRFPCIKRPCDVLAMTTSILFPMDAMLSPDLRLPHSSVTSFPSCVPVSWVLWRSCRAGVPAVAHTSPTVCQAVGSSF